MTTRVAPRTLAAGALLGLLAVTTLSACTGGGDDTADKNELADADDDGSVSPEEVMAYAKQLLDGTSGVEIRLSTGDVPDEGNFLAEAEGTITTQPAFDGTASGRVAGYDAADIGIVSVDGTVWIDLPVLGWSTDYQPDDFCAPDPAQLLDPDTGVSPRRPAREDREAGGPARGGEDNKQTLTPYAATVPAEQIRNILPCSESGDFEATYRIDGEGYLQSADITGVFFPDSDPITYSIEVLDYDVEQEITAPR